MLLNFIKRFNSQDSQPFTKGLPGTVEQQEPGHGCGGVRGGLHLQHLEGLAGGVAEDEEVLDQVVGLIVRLVVSILLTSLGSRLTVAASTKDVNLECVYCNLTPVSPE